MKFDITTKPLSEEETDVILGVYDTAQAAYDAVQRDAGENARAEFRDPCNAAVEIIAQLESDLATAEQDSRQKQARIERLETALGEIAWSNDSKWQSDRAHAALEESR